MADPFKNVIYPTRKANLPHPTRVVETREVKNFRRIILGVLSVIFVLCCCAIIFTFAATYQIIAYIIQQIINGFR